MASGMERMCHGKRMKARGTRPSSGGGYDGSIEAVAAEAARTRVGLYVLGGTLSTERDKSWQFGGWRNLAPNGPRLATRAGRREVWPV